MWKLMTQAIAEHTEKVNILNICSYSLRIVYNISNIWIDSIQEKTNYIKMRSAGTWTPGAR